MSDSEDAAYREAVINDAEADVSTLSTLGMTECGNEASRSPGISTLSTLSTRVPSEYAELLSGLRDGAWLDQQTFPPLKWAVPGLIPEGMSLLVGPPKAGKSFFLGSVLLSIASGGLALGCIQIPRARPVLYLALEDGDRRMQARARHLLEGEPIPGHFHYLTKVLPTDLFAVIQAWMEIQPDTAMVVVDTLGKVKPEARPMESAYQHDYRVGATLKELADDHPGLAVVVVHHDRKALSDDFVESVSGTNGLAGAADAIAVLARKRQSSDGILQITGRDVPEERYGLKITDGRWRLDGSNLKEAAQAARERESEGRVSDRMMDVLQLAGASPDGVTPAAVAEALEMEPKHAGQYLSRAAERGDLVKVKRGLYMTSNHYARAAPSPSVESVESVENAGQGAIPFPHSA